jgi:integrase
MTAAARPWQDALLAGVPMAARELPRARSVLAGLARFAAGQGIAASPEWLLDFDVVEAFCVRGCAGRASSTRGTYRSVLYLLAAPVHGVAGRRRTPFAGAGAPAPYPAAERAELAAVAAAQRDPARRASALAMVVFGIGAGLRPGELAALRGTDVARAGGQVVVHVSVRGGPAPRTVPVHPRYARRALVLARAAGGQFVFCPGPADRGYKNFVNVFAARLAADPAAPRLSAGRCRASFICDHLAAGAPVPVLLEVSGITEPESLARYARHVRGMNASKAALRARCRAERTP